MTPTPRRVQLMYGNGGGGHKASASAVAAVLRDMQAPDQLPLLVDLVDAASISGAAAGDWLYNILLSYNAVSAIEVMHSVISVLMPVAIPALRTSFRAYWASVPDLACVVSFVPMLNAVFAETLPSHIPLFTVLTDFSHTRSHPWIQHPRQHIVAGTDIAFAQALATGYMQPAAIGTSHTVTRSSGMVVHPRFYTSAHLSLQEKRRVEMNLHPTLPTVLILFGGAPPTDRVAELVERFIARQTYSPVNLIAVCSRNKQLYERLKRRKARNPNQHIFITGFSTEIPLLMQMSDVLIGKPGPGVVSEAYVSQLPCVLVTGASEECVMKQEKDVLDWVRRAGIGMVVRSPADAAKITAHQMAEMKLHITSQAENRAVFEVGDLIFNALGYRVPSNDDCEDGDSDSCTRLPQEADIGEMDVGVQVSQSTARREGKQPSIHTSDEDHSINKISSREGAAVSRRSGRPNPRSPTTITALPARRPGTERQHTLPGSRAVLTKRQCEEGRNQRTEGRT